MNSSQRHPSPYPPAPRPVLTGFLRWVVNPTSTLPPDSRPWRTVGILLAAELVLGVAAYLLIAVPVIEAIRPPEQQLQSAEGWEVIVGLVIFAVLIAAMVFADERLTRRKLVAAALGFAGVLIVARPGFGVVEPGVLAAAVGIRLRRGRGRQPG